jgi:hypothetical protein
MNERVKELMLECYNPYSNFDYEKFAELFVKECGVALNPMLRDMISRGHGYELIKEHFGVK